LIKFPDVIISANALKAIFSNFMPQLDENWTIPVVVRRYGDKNVVFVDKTLPPTSMTSEDKTAYFCKKSVQMRVTTSWDRGRGSIPDPKKCLEEAVANVPARGDDLFDDVVDLTSLETFGMADCEKMPQVGHKLLRD